MLEFEKSLFEKGIKYIAGVDEVGRGPLAGPMVISAVILDLEKIFSAPEDTNYDVEHQKLYSKIDDSKKLTENARNTLSDFIKTNCLTFSIIEISHTELDAIGISQATQKGFFNSVQNLKIPAQHVFTDAFKIKNLPGEIQTNIIKGDSKSITIAAASIVAKAYRDDLMINYSKVYPEYGFEKHKGYGTKFHRDRLKERGPCEIHRRSFNLTF